MKHAFSAQIGFVFVVALLRYDGLEWKDFNMVRLFSSILKGSNLELSLFKTYLGSWLSRLFKSKEYVLVYNGMYTVRFDNKCLECQSM